MKYQDFNKKKDAGLPLKAMLMVCMNSKEFKYAFLISLFGVCIVFLSALFASTNIKILISIIGCLVSYAGFDHISKLIAAIQKTASDEGKDNLND